MFYFRADGNEKIAMGHVMRCLSIADAAREQGESAAFLLADGQAVPLLRQRGYEAIVLDSPWDDMEAELPALRRAVRERGIQKLLIDSYQVTPRYLEEASQMASTVYMDDLDRFRYPVDALVYYAADWESHHYQERYHNKLFLGPQYAPLRKAFQNCGKKRINPVAKNLLLLSGGTDPYGILGKLLARIDRRCYERIEVICGMYDPQYGRLQELYQGEANLYFYQAVSDMEAHMGRACMAVTAGGTTLYELCAMGVPTVSYSMADNQIPNVQKFHEMQLIDYAGDIRNTDVAGHISGLLEKYQEDMSLRQERSQRMQELVDGKGAARIADGIIKL